MGKNQTYKAMQRARLGSSSSATPEDVDDGMTDGSFHSPEWHAARLASLKTSHTVTWEEFKRKQKEDEAKKGELEADKDRMMKEYRAQLDAERAVKLSRGRNHSDRKSRHKKERKEDYKKKSSKRRKHSRRFSESSSSDSSSESSSSDDEERESKRSRSRSKRKKRSSRHDSKSRSKHSTSDDEGGGPLPLSRFFGTAKT